MSNVLSTKEKFLSNFLGLERSFYDSAKEIDKQIMEIEGKARAYYLTLVSELFDDVRIKSDEKSLLRKGMTSFSLLIFLTLLDRSD